MKKQMSYNLLEVNHCTLLCTMSSRHWGQYGRVVVHACVACRSETCAILKHVLDWHGVPFWKMCISKTCFRLAPCKLCHIEGRWQYVFFNHYIWSSPTFVTEKQTKKERNAVWPYFWSLFTNFYASRPCIYHATSIWRSLHKANLKHVSEMHIFQNGTPCQYETCFRVACNTCVLTSLGECVYTLCYSTSVWIFTRHDHCHLEIIVQSLLAFAYNTSLCREAEAIFVSIPTKWNEAQGSNPIM